MSRSPPPAGKGPAPAGPAFYRIVCSCGAKLRIRHPRPGGVCRCPRCDRRHTVGAVPAAPPVGQPPVGGKAGADAGTCSACYTPIGPGEERQTCPACGLAFHADCWQENLGCSAYGCSQVNALRKGPDLSIPLAAAGAAPPPLAGQALPPAAAPARLPWHVLFLAASAAGVLLSLLTCGVPSLLVGAAAVFYLVAASERRQAPWLIGALVVAVVGFLVGVIASALFYPYLFS